jgi:hypothetical protein
MVIATHCWVMRVLVSVVDFYESLVLQTRSVILHMTVIVIGRGIELSVSPGEEDKGEEFLLFSSSFYSNCDHNNGTS